LQGGTEVTKIKINDRWYEPTLEYEMEVSDGFTEIRPKFPSGEYVHKATKPCPMCHRSDLVPVVYRSMAEAINAGLFVETSAP
jgi:hypothetical protein